MKNRVDLSGLNNNSVAAFARSLFFVKIAVRVESDCMDGAVGKGK